MNRCGFTCGVYQTEFVANLAGFPPHTDTVFTYILSVCAMMCDNRQLTTSEQRAERYHLRLVPLLLGCYKAKESHLSGYWNYRPLCSLTLHNSRVGLQGSHPMYTHTHTAIHECFTLGLWARSTSYRTLCSCSVVETLHITTNHTSQLGT